MTEQPYMEPVVSCPNDQAVAAPLADPSRPSPSPVTSTYPHLSYTATAVRSVPSQYVGARRAPKCRTCLTLRSRPAGPVVCVHIFIRPSSSNAHIVGRIPSSTSDREAPPTLQLSTRDAEPAATHSSGNIHHALAATISHGRAGDAPCLAHRPGEPPDVGHPKPLRRGLYSLR